MKKNGYGGDGPVDVQRPVRSNGLIPASFRAFSSYLRVVSSGASTVARSAASVASSIVDRDGDPGHDQLLWAGYDTVECEGNTAGRVLLLGYRSGFQVWDVEEGNNVRQLVSRHDGPVSFMQVLPKPIALNRSTDKFSDSRPLLAVCADGSFSGGFNGQVAPGNRSLPGCHDPVNVGFSPTTVWFYSLRTQSYAHVLKFRSVVYSVRCSSRVVAVLQATQIHCFDSSTLEREYNILTNPIVVGGLGSGGIGYGPLAVGPRWVAYSGSPVVVSDSGHVSPQQLPPSSSFPRFSSNGSLVAHYAKESSKQLGAGVVTLGDMGYKKLSRYCSEFLPDSNDSPQSATLGLKGNGVGNGLVSDTDSIGMVIVRDIVSKSVIAQFKAHKSPISALCFDSSGTLLVTASVQGHNINVFKIMPLPSASEGGTACAHLYRLQRGFTNAVIQDISFSDDSSWITISSSRGTCHLFAINPLGGPVNLQPARSIGPAQQGLCASGPPVTLSVVSRIRNGNSGWKGTVSGAAMAATGRAGSLPVAIASSFHNPTSNKFYVDGGSLRAKYHLLVYSPGCVIQYALTVAPRLSAVYEPVTECDGRLVVEAIRKWSICQKQNRAERDDVDIYGENGSYGSKRIYPEVTNELIAGGRVMKSKMSPEEKQYLFISEAELQMHQLRVPLWAKSEIYFQSMKVERIEMDADNSSGGEIEIEGISACMIEARPRGLVPISDDLQTPKLEEERVSAVDATAVADRYSVQHSKSGLYEDGQLSCKSNSGSLDSMTDTGFALSQSQALNGFETSFVNNTEGSNLDSQSEIVNNRDSLTMETQPDCVDNNEGMEKTGKHFEEDRDEFD